MSTRKGIAIIVAPVAGAMLLTALALSILARGPEPATAAAPFVAEAVGAFGGTLDYGAAARLTPTVPANAAIALARTFTQTDARSVIHSTGLARYSDLKDKDVLVWVIDIDGLNMPAMGGGLGNGHAQPGRTITRAVVLVSATQAETVVGMFSSPSPNK